MKASVQVQKQSSLSSLFNLLGIPYSEILTRHALSTLQQKNIYPKSVWINADIGFDISQLI